MGSQLGVACEVADAGQVNRKVERKAVNLWNDSFVICFTLSVDERHDEESNIMNETKYPNIMHDKEFER